MLLWSIHFVEEHLEGFDDWKTQEGGERKGNLESISWSVGEKFD